MYLISKTLKPIQIYLSTHTPHIYIYKCVIKSQKLKEIKNKGK